MLKFKLKFYPQIFNKKLRKIKRNPIKPPEPPKSWECCGDSCPNCVWDLYFKDLRKFRLALN